MQPFMNVPLGCTRVQGLTAADAFEGAVRETEERIGDRSGRGKQPAWVKEALAASKSLEDLGLDA